jgi:uncharacterized protein (TIGR02117 family)
MKRPRTLVAGLIALGLAGYLFIPLPAPAIPPPSSAEDCVQMRMWSNGYHSDIGFAADILPADHPLRRLYPEARSLLIGWGERAFYYSDGTDLWLGLDAMIPPSPSVMHVVDGAEDGARYLGPKADATFAISRAGAASLAAYLARALTLDADGAVIPTSTGKVVGHSFFVEARENFHLFNVCNHWMARALRSAGININTRNKWLAAPLLEEARRAAPAVCPAAAAPMLPQ